MRASQVHVGSTAVHAQATTMQLGESETCCAHTPPASCSWPPPKVLDCTNILLLHKSTRTTLAAAAGAQHGAHRAGTPELLHKQRGTVTGLWMQGPSAHKQGCMPCSAHRCVSPKPGMSCAVTCARSRAASCRSTYDQLNALAPKPCSSASARRAPPAPGPHAPQNELRWPALRRVQASGLRGERLPWTSVRADCQ